MKSKPIRRTNNQNEQQGVVQLSARLEAIAKRANRMTKAVRIASNGLSYSADYDDKGKDRETYITRPKGRKLTKKEKEIAAVKRILPKLNQANGAQFEIIPNQQPLDNSSTDVLLTDSLRGKKLEVQVRVSDDTPHKDVETKGQFYRDGNAYKINKEAIKRAINEKTKRCGSLGDRRRMLLILDGWPWLTAEHLARFKKQEYKIMTEAGFKEIWFSGQLDETKVRLFP
jgi:hypothetical protein